MPRSSLIDLSASDLALFLDLDGTLSPIVEDPDLVGPDPVRNGLLADLQTRLCGRLAVISGRGLDDLDRILDGRVERLSGSHGLERRIAAGRAERPDPPPGLAEARRAALAFVAARPGVRLEDKALSVAVHYRAVPAHEADVRAWGERLGAATGLGVQHGKMVLELRPPGAHKGDALAAFMAEAPFLGATPVFVGDDLTDEHAFEAARALGGYGVLVGPERTTAAAGRLADPAAVLAWLAAGRDTGQFTIEGTPR